MNSVSGAQIDWRAKARALRFRTKPFIDGRFVASAEPGRFGTINPATEEAFCELPIGCAADVDQAVAAARRAFDDGRWSSLAPDGRKRILLTLADLVERNADELALLDTLEVGKAVSTARAEIAMSTGLLRYFAEGIDKAYGAVAPSGPETIAYTMFVPHGVVGAIVPWNFPLANAVVKAAPALAAGNAVVLKPSEISSLSALRLAELAAEAGIPDGIFNVVPGLGATVGQFLAAHRDVDFLTFTGSTATGRQLMVIAGQSNGKPLMLELGGKSAQIVCSDMADDVPALAAQVAHEAFWNAGQWCAARSRLIVEDGIHDRLLEAVFAASERMVPGDPLDATTNFGTIATRGQFERVQDFVSLGVQEGARILYCGGHGTPCSLSMGPIVFGDVEPAMRIAQEEIFGPVLSVFRFRDFAEAINIANNSEYGLGATLWTRDGRRAATAAAALRAGKIAIRGNPAIAGSAGLALGGEPLGASGYGIERGMGALQAYSRSKAVTMLF